MERSPSKGWRPTDSLTLHKRGSLRRVGGKGEPLELHELDLSPLRTLLERIKEAYNPLQVWLFDLLQKNNLGNTEREKIKLASQSLLDSLYQVIAPLEQWTEKERTRADVRVSILDHLHRTLPKPPFTDEEMEEVTEKIFQHVWQKSASGDFPTKIAA